MGQGRSLEKTGDKKRTNFASAKGQGSSYRGSKDWLLSRSLLLFSIPLSLFLFVSLITKDFASSYNRFHEWLNNPFNFTMLILTIVVVGYNLLLELLSTINDYIDHKATNLFLIILVRGLFYFVITLSVISVFLTLV